MSAPPHTPSGQGYRMPAEWERHACTWMGWPQRKDNWREEARPAQKAYCDVARTISKFTPVVICCNPEQVKIARQCLPGHIAVWNLEQDDAWFRDTGPTFVCKQEALAGVDWDFNGWGGDVLPCCELDKKVAEKLLKKLDLPIFKAGFVLEGGSIHTDGEGTLLTTEECLLHSNRNKQLSKQQIEQKLMDYTGTSKVIWLPQGLLADEDTNGHIDNFACFAAPGVVLLCWPSVHDPEQLARSEAALTVLEASTDAKGRPFKIIKFPLPPPLHYESHEEIRDASTGQVIRKQGDRLAASYVNFYITNGGIVMPAFGGKAADTDKVAEKLMREIFDGHEVVVIESAREILLGGGNIHCITQQQPQTIRF